MKDKEIYYAIIVPLKKFYLIDYAVNYLIDLETADRYINEPYIQPILEDLYYIYADNEATPIEMLTPYMQELAEKIEWAENNMLRITAEDYEYLKYTHKLLKKNDLDFATFLAHNQLTYTQCDNIRHHHTRLNDDEFIPIGE